LRRRIVAVTLLAWAVAACASILGIEELPVAVDEPDAGVEAGAPDVADAGLEACTDNYALGCRSCPHAFCDDFDQEDAALGAQWTSLITPSGGLLFRQRSDGGARGTRVPVFISPPSGFEAFVTTDAGSSYAFLVNQLPKHTKGPTFAGIRFRIQSRVKKLDLAGPDAGGRTDNRAAFAALGPQDPTQAMIGFVASPKGFDVVLGGNFLADDLDAASHPVFESPLTEFGDQAVLIEVFVTTRERAVAERLEKCRDEKAPTVIGVRINNIVNRCVPLDGVLANLDWTLEPAVGVGAGTFDNGTVQFIHDNAMLDFLE